MSDNMEIRTKLFDNEHLFHALILLLSIFVVLYGNTLIMLRSDIFFPNIGLCHIKSVNSYVFSEGVEIIFDTLYEFEHLSYFTQIDIPCYIKNLTRCEELH